MSAQLTPEGIDVYTQEEIIQLIEDSLQAELGILDTEASSVNGQLIGVYSKPTTDLSELIEDVYLSFSPSNAEGISLDYILLLNGLTRLPAVPTRCPIGLKGTNNTVIPQGTIVKSEPPASDSFETETEYTISNLQQLVTYIQVDTYTPSKNYITNIDGVDYIGGSGVGGDVTDVALVIHNSINGSGTAPVVSEITIGNDWLKLTAKSAAVDIIVDPETTLWSQGEVLSVEKDAIPSTAGTITIIDTPVAGLTEVYNFETGVTGRPIESDADARLRRLDSLQVVGAGTLPSIVARMQRVEDVVTVRGFENRTDVTDIDGRPPHSIEIVVQGGTDEDIGELLWQVKPGGIETFGNTTYIIIDDNGDPQAMNFTRPVSKYAHIRATITLHAEEIFPTNGADLIKEAILEFGNTFNIGQDLIRDRFYVPVFTVEGVETVVIAMDLTATIGDTPTYTSPDLIPVAASEIAVFDLSNIEVVIV